MEEPYILFCRSELAFLSNSETLLRIFKHFCSKINPSDCNDMDCDALKKAMVEDLDGSLMGTQGTWISVSEYEWDGDPRRGMYSI